MDNSVCIDTDILASFFRNKPEEVALIEEYERRGTITTTIVNLFELYFGAYLSGRENNVKQVEEFERRVNILPLTKEAVKLSGKILAELRRTGEEIEFRDLFIGCIAREAVTPLKTKNTKRFERLKKYGLRLL